MNESKKRKYVNDQDDAQDTYTKFQKEKQEEQDQDEWAIFESIINEPVNEPIPEQLIKGDDIETQVEQVVYDLPETQSLSTIDLLNKEKLYVYNAFTFKKNVCFQDYEKERVEENITESIGRFIKKDCDIYQTYKLSKYYHSCNASINLRDLYSYFTSKKSDLFYFVDKPINLIDEAYDINMIHDFKKDEGIFKYSIAKNLASTLRNQILTGSIDSVIFLNCSIDYINYPSDNPRKRNWGHHVSLLVKKISENEININRIDTGCLNSKERLMFKETMISLYKNKVGETGKEIAISINFSFEDFLKKKYDISDDEKELEELEELCKDTLQEEEENLFGYGFCVSWGVFFMVEIFFKQKDLYDIYNLIYDMESVERAKFIYVWYDVFYTEMRKAIPEVFQSLRR